MRIALLAILLTILYYKFIFKPKQDAKNKTKQERKERTATEEIFRESPTCFLQNGYECFGEEAI